MTLNLSMTITADSRAGVAGVGEMTAAVKEMGASAQRAGADAQRVVGAIDAITTSAGRATAEVAAAQAQLSRLSAASIDQALGVRSSFGGAARAADIAAFGRALDDLQARVDPAAAALQKYRADLALVSEAHRLGAIDGETMVRRQVELTAAYERSAAAARNAGAAAKLAAQTYVDRQTIVPDRSADIAAYGAALDQLQAAVDPAYAALMRYRGGLDLVAQAHKVGAIDGETMVRLQVDLAAAYERSSAAARNAGAAAKAAAQTAVNRQTIVPDRAADIAAYGKELDGLRARFNPVWAAGQQYRQTVQDIAQAERVGAITAAEASAAKERARVATGQQVAALRAAAEAHNAHSGAMKLNAFQAQQLSYQLNDVFVSLASGQNPLTVAIQQGSQITPIFGGVRNTFAALTAVITPTTAALGAGALALGLGAKAWYDYAAAQRAARITAQGVGRNTGVTAGELDAIAQNGARAGEISISQARSVGMELLATGKIGRDAFAGIVAASKDFATTIGTDVETAGKTLADLFSDPARGAQTLYQQYNLIDGATARQVQRLVDQNRLYDAQRTLLDGVRGNLIRASEVTSGWAAVYERVARGASDAYDAIGRTVDKAQSKDPFWYSRIVTDPAGFGFGLGQALRGQEAQAKEDQAAAAKRAADALAKQRADVALGIAGQSPALQSLTQRGQLEQQLARLKEGMDQPGLTAADRFKVVAAIDATTRALGTWLPEQQQAIQLAQIDLQIAEARDPVTRAALEAKRQETTLAGQVLTIQQAQAQIDQARAASIAAAISQSKIHALDLADEAAARRKVNDAVTAGTLSLADADRQLQLELELRPLLAAIVGKEGAERQQLQERIDALTGAYRSLGAETQRAAALSQIRSQRDGLDQTRLEISLVGQSEAVRARSIAALQAEQRIRDLGIAKYGQEAAEIRRLSAAQADATTTLARQQDAWREVSGSIGGAIDQTVDAVARGKDLGQTFQGIAQDISAEALKLAVSNPLKNALLGQNNATLADAGGFLGQIFGGGAKSPAAAIGASLGTATITAGTVIVNGGVSGGAIGALTGATNDKIAGAWSAFSSGGIDRSRFGAEILDPATRNRLFAITEAEVGGQGAQAQQAFLESVFNRASARGQTLAQTLTGSYFPQATYDRAATFASGSLEQKYATLLDQVRGGSNISGFATGNASGSVGFGAGGYQTAMLGGEKFGVEAQDLSWIAKQSQAGAAIDRLTASTSSATSGLTGLASANDNAVKAVTSFGSGMDSTAKSVVGEASGAAGGGGLGGSIGQIVTGIGGVFRSLFSGIGSALSSVFGSLFGISTGPLDLVGAAVGKASGGPIVGPGTGTSDSIPIWASNGEFVVRASAAAKHGALLHAINNDALPRFAAGGPIGAPLRLATVDGRAFAGAGNAGGGSTAPTEVHIHNTTGARVTTTESTTSRGGRRTDILLEEATAASLDRPGSAAQRSMAQTYGVRRRVAQR